MQAVASSHLCCAMEKQLFTSIVSDVRPRGELASVSIVSRLKGRVVDQTHSLDRFKFVRLCFCPRALQQALNFFVPTIVTVYHVQAVRARDAREYIHSSCTGTFLAKPQLDIR